jgi:predicted DNA-binding protein (UPF0251 family)
VEQYPSPEDFIIMIEDEVPPYTRRELPESGRAWDAAKRVCTPREFEVLELRLLELLTFREVGAALKITRQAAADAYNRAINRVKEALLHGR